MSGFATLQEAVLAEIQSGFPLERHPYEALAEVLEAKPVEVIAAVEHMREGGLIRRIGASFSSTRLGFTSTLCALAVDGDERAVDQVAAIVSSHVEVTHNYLRDDRYNLWFTVIAQDGKARDDVLGAIVAEAGCDEPLVLPAVSVYKIRVDFGGKPHLGKAPAPAAPFKATSSFDKALVRWAQGDITGEEPFAAAAIRIAAELHDPSIDESCVIGRLRSWKADGTIRRFGAMVAHRKMGYAHNGMCVFDADPAHLDEMGRALSEPPFVSHCYARARSGKWPYNLYAMVHAKTSDELGSHVEELRARTRLEPKVLVSTKEYKKTSPVYFDNAPSMDGYEMGQQRGRNALRAPGPEGPCTKRGIARGDEC